ncbi:MAG: hypothetical protein PHE17_18175 [Thiothrix sp.]|uniref:hypothetical protein n=1 Tax=Thiothrix sp. TaxID=1032 RepID=UPI002624AE43|nr:hypothetical protein [Thiothrix sp.]MDD5394949.1 hypothetical protein [Thiothrix sp.]
MKTIFDASRIVTGSIALWKGAPWDVISGAIAAAEDALHPGPDSFHTTPSHVDILEVKDSGIIMRHGMSWPRTPYGEYYYAEELTTDCLEWSKSHLVGILTNPDLIASEFMQIAARDWLREQQKEHFQYGVENLFRDLFKIPCDPARPVCSMFAAMFIRGMSGGGVSDDYSFVYPKSWVTDWNVSPLDIQAWGAAMRWGVPFCREVPDDYQTTEIEA